MLRYRGCYLKVLSCLAKHSDWLNSLILKSIPLFWSCLGCRGQLFCQKELARAPCSWKLYRLLPSATHQPGRPRVWDHFYYFRHSVSAHPFNKTTSVCGKSVHKLVNDCVRWYPIKNEELYKQLWIQVSCSFLQDCVGLKWWVLFISWKIFHSHFTALDRLLSRTYHVSGTVSSTRTQR